MSRLLPPGQQVINSFPRFGLSHFAKRFPKNPDQLNLTVSGLAANRTENRAGSQTESQAENHTKPLDKTALVISTELEELQRVEQVSDFHCVTTWTCCSLHWSGYRFRDFYQQIVLSSGTHDPEATQILIKGQDGYQSSLMLEDLLADDVLLADRLFDQPLSIEHGAPLRLIAPAHYGYKNIKHINRIEFLQPGSSYKNSRCAIHGSSSWACRPGGAWPGSPQAGYIDSCTARLFGRP